MAARRPLLAALLTVLFLACSHDDPADPGSETLAGPKAPAAAARAPKATPEAYRDSTDGGWTSMVHKDSVPGSGDEMDGDSLESLSKAEGAGGGFGGGRAELRHRGAERPMADMAAPPPGAPAGGAEPEDRASQQALAAGEVDDNERFDQYLDYHQSNSSSVPEAYRLDITERYRLDVTDATGRSLPDCAIGIAGGDEILCEGRTDASGRLYFFPRTSPAAEGVERFQVTVQYGGATEVLEFDRAAHGSDEPWTVTLPVAKATGPVALDLLFLLDTTGSMADELAQVQATLRSITERIQSLDGQPAIRFGMVLYRDRTDEYVTRRFGFTEDVEAFDRALQEVEANGGGDYAEAMNMGLFAAVDQMAWRDGALRLAFLVADATPHTDYTDDVPYPVTLRSAVARGIKIFPTAASGLDPVGSYVMRQIAQFTGARFLFIEYGANTAASHGVEGPTDSNNLDDLVVRIVTEELAAWTR